MKTNSWALIFTGLGLSGCSHNLGVTEMAKSPHAGAVYVLPYTQYTSTMTWRLADCSASSPKVAMKVEITSGFADDGEQAYSIDPASLQTLTSIGTFSAKWQEGSNALASINVSAEDRTAAIIGNVVKGVAKLAPLVMGVPMVANSGHVCSLDAKKALDSAQALKPQLDDLNDRVEASTAEIARLLAKTATMGTAVDDATKAKLSAEIEKLATFRNSQATVADQLAAALKAITVVRKETWPLDSRSTSGGPFDDGGGSVAKWFTEPVTTVGQVYLQLERVGSFGQDPAAVRQLSSGRTDKGLGLRYRVSARGRIVACTISPCTSQNPAKVLAVLEGPVAQLGYVQLLPVRNRTFGSTSFTAEFTPQGGLRSVGYEQKTAPAEGASGAFLEAAGEVAGVLDPTARLARETAYLEALKKRRDAAGDLEASPDDPVGTAKAALEADTSLLTAEASNVQARITLDELRRKLQQ